MRRAIALRTPLLLARNARVNGNTTIHSLYNIAVVMVRWKGLPDAQSYVDKARQALMPLLDTDEHVSGLYCLGGLEALCDNNEQALNYLQQAVLLGKDDVVDWAQHDIAWVTQRATDERFRALLTSA